MSDTKINLSPVVSNKNKKQNHLIRLIDRLITFFYNSINRKLQIIVYSELLFKKPSHMYLTTTMSRVKWLPLNNI